MLKDGLHLHISVVALFIWPFSSKYHSLGCISTDGTFRPAETWKCTV